MAIFYIRHGQSLANKRSVFAGQRDDSLLTNMGEYQAKQAVDDLVGIDINLIISSNLKRASKTASIIANLIGYKEDKIIYDDRIIEYDMGDLTGSPIKNLTSIDLVNSAGSEDPLLFRQRVISFLQAYNDYPANVLVVSHAAVGRAIECAKQNLDPYRFYDLAPYPNARVIELDLRWLPTTTSATTTSATG